MTVSNVLKRTQHGLLLNELLHTWRLGPCGFKNKLLTVHVEHDYYYNIHRSRSDVFRICSWEFIILLTRKNILVFILDF